MGILTRKIHLITGQSLVFGEEECPEEGLTYLSETPDET